MPSFIDVFNQDAYNVINLTTGIETVPLKLGRLGASGLFKVEGVTTWVVALEFRAGKLALIPAKTRSSGETTMQPPEAEKVRPFIIPHLPYDDALMAADVQGVREFGSQDGLKTINGVLQRKLLRMRDAHETTHEYHRVGAIQGIVKDANGVKTLINLFTEFGVAEKIVYFDLDDTTTDVGAVCDELVDYIAGQLGGTTFTGVTVQCGATFWQKLISHASVVAAWEVWQEGRFLRERPEEGGVQRFIHRGVTFERYVGQVGDVKFIPDGVGRAYPTGVDDLFLEYYGPADFVEAVNTVGKNFYASQEPMKHNRGIDIHTQSNPCMLCSQPDLLVKCESAAAP